MRAYHRFDFGIQFHKEKRWENDVEISVYNLYNRMNPFFYYTDYEIKNNKEYGFLRQVTFSYNSVIYIFIQVLKMISFKIKYLPLVVMIIILSREMLMM
jgi:hypothetical protein